MRLLVQVIVVVGILTSCDSCGESLLDIPDIFEGTWKYHNPQASITDKQIVAIRGTWIMTMFANNTNEMKGTYTVSGNIVNMIATHEWVGGAWQSTSYTPTATITGNTLIFSDDGNTYTRQ